MEIARPLAPPTGWKAFLFRLPVHLYRARLGWLLGSRFLFLTHIGRKSGRPRHTVVEVARRLSTGYDVCSGFGERSQWYRNVLANPRVTIQVGRFRASAEAVPLDPDQGEEVIVDYARRHPRAAKHLCRAMGFVVDGSESDYREVGRRLPFVRFVPDLDSTP